MANAATMSIIINAKDMASKTIAGIGGSLNNLQKTANRVQRSFNDFKNSYNELARGAEIALGAIGAAGGAIFMFSKNTEKAMANASTMFNKTAKDFEKYLGKDISKISMQYGQNLESMWQATYDLGSAGITLENVPAVLQKVAKAAVAGNTDTSTAFTGAIKQIKAFGLEIKDLERVFAVQFQSVQKGLLTYEELAQSIPEVAATARTLGENWVDATATFAELTKYMPDASQAANALSNVYNELTEKSESLKEAGIELYRDGKFIGFSKVLRQITSQIDGKTNEEVAQFFNSLGLSEEAGNAVKSLVNNYESLQNTLSSTTDDVSALNEMFEKQTSTAEWQFRKLVVVLDNLKQTIYSAFKDTLGKWIQKAAVWVQGLTRWIEENKDQFVELISAVVRLLGVIIGFNIALNIFSKLGSVLSALTNPFTWILGAIAAVFTMLEDQQKEAIFEWIGKAIDNIISYVKELFSLLSNDGFMAVLQKIFKDIGSLFGNIGNFTIGIAVEVVKWLGDKIPEWINKGKQAIDMLIAKVDESGLPQWAKNVLKGALNTAKLALDLVGDAYDWLSGIIGATKEMFLNIKNGEDSPLSAVLKWLSSIVDTTVKFGINILSDVLGWLYGLFGADSEAVENFKINLEGTAWEWYEKMKEWEDNAIQITLDLLMGKNEFEDGTLFNIGPFGEEKKNDGWLKYLIPSPEIFLPGGYKGGQFDVGGYTGDGGKYQPAGIVHAGEYVIPQWLVKKAPGLVGTIENVRKQGYANGGAVGFLPGYFDGGDVVELLKKYFIGGEEDSGVSKDINTTTDTVGYIFDFVKNYIPEQEEELSVIQQAVNEMLGIQKSDEEKPEKSNVEKTIDKLYTFFPEMKQYYDKDKGEAGNLGKIFSLGMAGQGSMKDNFLGGFAGLFKDLIGPLGEAVAMLSNVQALLNPITTIVEGMMTILGPLINNALMPFVNILTNLGKMLGTLLVPLLNPLLAGLQAFAAVLTWMYNKVIRPIAQGFYIAFGMVASGFNDLYNTISWFIGEITFGAINMGKRAVKSMDQIIKEAGEKFQEIDIKKQDEYNTEYKSSVTSSGPENVYNTFNINANDSFIQDSQEKFKTLIFKLIKEYEKESGLKFAT